MTIEKFYQRSIPVPYVIGAISVAITFIARRFEPLFGSGAFARFASFVAMISLCAIVPYSIYVAVVWFFARPHTATQYRRTFLLAPLAIAIPYGAIYQAAEGIHGNGLERLSEFFFYSGAALITGFGCVILIESARLLAAHFGLIEHAQMPQ